MGSLVLLNETSEEFIKMTCSMKDELPFAEGYSGRVYRISEYRLKEFKHPEKEYEILQELQGLDFIPTLFAYSPEKWMMTDFVEGETINEYLHKNPDHFSELIYILEQHVKEINKRGWIARDLNEENIIVTDSGYPVIVDVGRFEKGIEQNVEDALIYLQNIKKDSTYSTIHIR